MSTLSDFESKVDMPLIRERLHSLCMSTLGQRQLQTMHFMTDERRINGHLRCISEMRKLQQADDSFPTTGYYDIGDELNRLRIDGTYLPLEAVVRLRSVLHTVEASLQCVRKQDGGTTHARPQYLTPTLRSLSKEVDTIPHLTNEINRIVDEHGAIYDTASPQLAAIRSDIAHEEKTMSGMMRRVLSALYAEKILDMDTAAVVRDGELLIPVPTTHRSKVAGVVHGESQGGNIVYIEPQEVVMGNMRLRSLRQDEHEEIVRILKRLTEVIRPHRDSLQRSLRWLGRIDFIHAKALLAEEMDAVEPHVSSLATIDWQEAYHPLLRMRCQQQGLRCTPLTIQLTEDVPMLVISGPNAGGKSVCLKTVGLLQHMVQCGLSVPMSAQSAVGTFDRIMIDIGDEQSIEDELSTYSSHLRQLKRMMQDGDEHSLLLIDELGGGTEPTAGGAIAEVILQRLTEKRCRVVVTTHYQNLKHFASTHEGVQNGAMLYDDANMQPMYELVMGQAGSSFALDIARRTGFAPDFINDVQTIVGEIYVKQERFLHDVYRDRKYWNNKRKSVGQLERQLQERIEKYTLKRQRLIDERDAILRQAGDEAKRILDESNRLIERTVREIRESGGDANRIREARRRMDEQRKELGKSLSKPATEKQKAPDPSLAANGKKANGSKILRQGMPVKIKGMGGTGIIEKINDTSAVVVTGAMRLKIDRKQLETQFEPTSQMPALPSRRAGGSVDMASYTDAAYSPSIDIRGQRAEQALSAVEQFIDQSVVRGMSSVRILHGKGDGILSSVVRKYLSDRKEVDSFHDEHVDFGGAGITIVQLK